MHARPPEQVPELERRLHRWTREGLISEETAGRIWAFERGSPTTPDRPAVRRRRVPVIAEAVAGRRVPLIAEAIGYLGAALAAAAGAVLLARSWDELSRTGRLVVPAAGFAVFLTAGFAIHRSPAPAVQRLASLLWFFATGAAGWFDGIFAAEVADLSDRAVLLSVGATIAVVAGCLYAYRPWPLSELALVAGLAALLAAALFERELAIGVSWTLLGLVWAGLGALRVVKPTLATVVIGGLLMMYGPVLITGERAGVGLPLGVAAAAAVVLLGAQLRRGGVIGIGVVGSFLYLVGAINHFLPGERATAVGILVIGVGLVVVAVLAMRTRPRHGPPRPAHG